MKKLMVLTLTIILIVGAFPALAQDDLEFDIEVLVDGLNNPRRFVVTDDGSIYITDPGLGGDIEAEGAFGPAFFGETGQIVVYSNGEVNPILESLPSAELSPTEYVGPSALYLGESGLWFLLGEGNRDAVDGSMVLAFWDMESEAATVVADFFAAEEELNPDGANIQTNPNDLDVTPDGTVMIADAGCNCIWSWTEADGLAVAHVWEDNPVPTSIDVTDEGDYYIGFLSGFPFAEGSARVEHYSADGELLDTLEGLTTVTDILWAEGVLYIVEFAMFGDQGWTPETGRLLAVGEEEYLVIAEGLNLPYHLEASPAGNFLVSVNTGYSEPGTGQIIEIKLAE